MPDPSTLPTLHLVCNAHIDPVWLWEWEEGAAEALSTFRTAAGLCEAFPALVFNHNEALLYQWVEAYEPALFARIQRLVAGGQWQIMGGWHLQPDCNLPSGESFVRQILLGRRYFQAKFGRAPTTAINFDSFGHSRGLVQVLAKSGYDSYIHCRPAQNDCPLEAEAYLWEGYDGSRVLAARAYGGYLSWPGRAHEKVAAYLEARPGETCGLLLWGIGNHGGGPSRADVERLAELMAASASVELRHSTPEAYFAQLRQQSASLPVHRGDLNPFSVGCYTSQIRIKQRHRRLENELWLSEKMAAAAWAQGRLPYPAEALHAAQTDLATAQFHDTLAGTSIEPVEAAALRQMDHGLEELARVKARAFFALAAGQPAARAGEIPILVYNPHPFPVQAVVEAEFVQADQNKGPSFTWATAHAAGRPLPTQPEQELSALHFEWRKRIVFAAELAPAQMNRFDCRLEVMPERPAPPAPITGSAFHFQTDRLEVVINAETGWLDAYRVDGADLLAAPAGRLLVMRDDADPWGMLVKRFRNLEGPFELLTPEEAARFAGVDLPALPPVRVIESGPVRTVVEALFGYGRSRAALHYKLPQTGTEVELELRVEWAERDRMLKLALPGPDPRAECRGQVAYGWEAIRATGDEAVAHKWLAVLSGQASALTVINDGTYGCDFAEGELRLSLLRAPAFSAHPDAAGLHLPPDRFSPRADQGAHVFRFWLNGGPAEARLRAIDREALAHNEPPMALAFFPGGGGTPPQPFVTLSDDAIQVTAAKKAEDGDDLILRLFEPTGQPRTATLALPFAGLRREVSLGAFELQTLRVALSAGTFATVGLTED
jgi:alpha-mannosidase